jgi:hypothetical protein
MIHGLLKEHSCFMKDHHWDETVWDITQAGYLIGINPKHNSPEAANQVVSNLMAKKSPAKCTHSAVPPSFSWPNSVIPTRTHS